MCVVNLQTTKNMWRLTCVVLVVAVTAGAERVSPRSGDELVSTVLSRCGDIGCVKENVLEYLDNVLGIQTDARSAKVKDLFCEFLKSFKI